MIFLCPPRGRSTFDNWLFLLGTSISGVGLRLGRDLLAPETFPIRLDAGTSATVVGQAASRRSDGLGNTNRVDNGVAGPNRKTACRNGDADQWQRHVAGRIYRCVLPYSLGSMF